MKIVRYKVRSVRKIRKTGDTEAKRWTFKVQSEALEKVKAQLEKGRRVFIRKEVKEKFRIITKWGNTTTRDPAPKPVKILVLHHSVTKQLSEFATILAEKAQMKILQSIGFARGLGGFSYGYAIFPSGRIYEGSGWGVIEAATGGFNTPTDSVVFVGNTTEFGLTQAAIDSAVWLGVWGQKDAQKYLTDPVEVALHSKFKATDCPGAGARDAREVIQRRINRAA
jgi:hypothetical protein